MLSSSMILDGKHMKTSMEASLNQVPKGDALLIYIFPLQELGTQ
jgi:hypothetical protein